MHPEINYEKTLRTDNFKQLIKNIKGSTGSQPSSTDRGTGGAVERKLIIKDVYIRDAEVTITISGLVRQSLSANLGDIHLKDIGENEGGLTPSAAFNILLSALYGGITSTVTGTVTNELGTAGNALEGLGKSTTRELKGASNSIKKLFGR